MKGVQVGRGACDPAATGATADACGGEERGRCTSGHVCECHRGWAGPNCLAHDGYDDIVWDPPEQITDVGFEPPMANTSKFLMIALGLLVAGFIVVVRWKKFMEGWTPIPDDDKSLGA